MQSKRTLQLTGRLGRTWLLAMGMLIAILVILEVIARNESIRQFLPSPGLGSAHRQFEIQVERLRVRAAKEENLECIILGNSQVLRDVDPAVIESRYKQITGSTIDCQNFGIRGTSTTTAAMLASIIVEDFHPQVLIYGTSFIDFADFRGLNANDAIMISPWIQHKKVAPNFEGWLIDHSIAYRSYLGAQALLFPINSNIQAENRNLERGIGEKGFMPSVMDATNKHKVTVGKTDAERLLPDNAPQFDEEHLSALESIFKLSQKHPIQLIILTMPVAGNLVNETSGQNAKEDYRKVLIQNSETYHVPVWFSDGVIDENDPASWYDFFHLNADGAKIFSKWLGITLGNAVINRELIVK